MIVSTAQLFKHAYGKYAVGAYNINNAEQAMGLFRGCIESKAPFIIQISKGARSYTDKRLLEAMIRAADEIFPKAIFAVHLDHGDEESCMDCIASGSATIAETIFDNRFMHVQELIRLGANIHIDGHVAVVNGVDHLSGATVMATDLRASAGLVIAGLCARGETRVERIYHLDRGYAAMEQKLASVGADITRLRSSPAPSASSAPAVASAPSSSPASSRQPC